MRTDIKKYIWNQKYFTKKLFSRLSIRMIPTYFFWARLCVACMLLRYDISLWWNFVLVHMCSHISCSFRILLIASFVHDIWSMAFAMLWYSWTIFIGKIVFNFFLVYFLWVRYHVCIHFGAVSSRNIFCSNKRNGTRIHCDWVTWHSS